jgi:hypothetical protein
MTITKSSIVKSKSHAASIHVLSLAVVAFRQDRINSSNTAVALCYIITLDAIGHFVMAITSPAQRLG